MRRSSHPVEREPRCRFSSAWMHLDRLTVTQMPSYAPSPTRPTAPGRTWRTGLGNLGAHTIDQLAATARNQLLRIQHRPDLIGGFLSPTGLSLEPELR